VGLGSRRWRCALREVRQLGIKRDPMMAGFLPHRPDRCWKRRVGKGSDGDAVMVWAQFRLPINPRAAFWAEMHAQLSPPIRASDIDLFVTGRDNLLLREIRSANRYVVNHRGWTNRAVANRGAPPAFAEFPRRGPHRRPGPVSATSVVHIRDIEETEFSRDGHP